jgi:hypothetical protein
MPKRIMPACFVNVDRMPEAAQVICGGKAGRPRAYDQHPLAAFGPGRRKFPSLFDGRVAKEALDRIDADGRIDLGAIARRFAGVITDAAHHRGKRIILGEHAPCALVVARFRVREP